jgi:hypothetical protein
MLWSEIYSSTKDQAIKKNAKIHLQLLRAQADRAALNRVAAEYERLHGRHPTNMRELIAPGLLPGPAVDPEGFVYSFDAEGKAQINPASPLFNEQLRDQQKP